MAIDILVQEAKGMSEGALMEVVRFMRFIKNEEAAAKKNGSDNNKRLRKAGLFKDTGKGWIADDFDAPIEDFI